MKHLLLIYLLIFCPIIQGPLAGSDKIQLRDICPPGFQLDEQNRCLQRNMYQFYDSLQDSGVGGTKTALPLPRDGFSPQQIDLGRYLFFDPLLSGDNSLSCANCHQPDKGFADGLGRSVGIGGHRVERSAPSLWNVAFQKRLFWDARAGTLEQQMLGPLYAKEEMGNSPKQLLQDLNNNEIYRELFTDAFSQMSVADSANDNESRISPVGITLSQVYTALAAFQSSLISLNSRYDQYAHGYSDALNKKELEGLNVFRSFVARCAECHTPPLFTNQQIAVIGAPESEGLPFDIGAERTFDTARLKGGFKVPSLRNVARTAPYMHSGKFKTLRETVAFYSGGRGHAVPAELKLELHWHIWEPNLSSDEMDRVVDFLHTLTDESFMPSVPAHLPSGLPSTFSSQLDHPPSNAINSRENNNPQGEKS
ncbi:MAG: cytochrome-c peroxidase [Pseudomonadales bacterium]